MVRYDHFDAVRRAFSLAAQGVVRGLRERGLKSSPRRAFSLAELLVVVGVIALLLSILLPALQAARRQAFSLHCTSKLKNLGSALRLVFTETKFYPYYDDGGTPIRYTWIDVLVQQRAIVDQSADLAAVAARAGYCPADLLPDPQNAVRYPYLVYSLDKSKNGIDYSYGIGVPLSSGGWAWAGDPARSRVFRDSDQYTANRVLAADGYTSGIYNLSGRMMVSGVWNDPTQFDNTMAWSRHGNPEGTDGGANTLFQDGHVERLTFKPRAETPLNTMHAFVWYRGEPLNVNPTYSYERDMYPSELPTNSLSVPSGSSYVYPDVNLPRWYTRNGNWTLIKRK